jgi:hypothetical protein
MADPIFLKSRSVLVADLNKLDVILSIKAAIIYYRELYGEPKRIWVNGKDVPDNIKTVEGFEIERRSGCQRGKVMVI